MNFDLILDLWGSCRNGVRIPFRSLLVPCVNMRHKHVPLRAGGYHSSVFSAESADLWVSLLFPLLAFSVLGPLPDRPPVHLVVTRLCLLEFSPSWWDLAHCSVPVTYCVEGPPSSPDWRCVFDKSTMEVTCVLPGESHLGVWCWRHGPAGHCVVTGDCGSPGSEATVSPGGSQWSGEALGAGTCPSSFRWL